MYEKHLRCECPSDSCPGLKRASLSYHSFPTAFNLDIYRGSGQTIIFHSSLCLHSFPTNHWEVLRLQGRKPQQFCFFFVTPSNNKNKTQNSLGLKTPPHHYMTTSLLNMFHGTFWSINFNVLITGLVNLLVNTFRKALSTYLLYQCDLGNTCWKYRLRPKVLRLIKVNYGR